MTDRAELLRLAERIRQARFDRALGSWCVKVYNKDAVAIEAALRACAERERDKSRSEWIIARLSEDTLHRLVPAAADADGVFTYVAIFTAIDAALAAQTTAPAQLAH